MNGTFTITAQVTLILSMTATILAAESTAKLTSEQQTQLLREATAAYEQGLGIGEGDIAAAKESFSTAATKYQLLIDSGIANPRLYENLGNASFKSGRLGVAIAAYEQAAALAPGDGTIQGHLNHALSVLDGGATKSTPPLAISEQFSRWNRKIPVNLRLIAGGVAWVAFWATLTIWLIRRTDRLRQLCVGTGLIAMLLAASIGWEWSHLPREEFGIVTSSTIVRTHNGESFPPLFEKPLAEGTRVDILENRDTWLRIKLADGTTCWIPSQSTKVITPPATPWG